MCRFYKKPFVVGRACGNGALPVHIELFETHAIVFYLGHIGTIEPVLLTGSPSVHTQAADEAWLSGVLCTDGQRTGYRGVDEDGPVHVIVAGSHQYAQGVCGRPCGGMAADGFLEGRVGMRSCAIGLGRVACG